MTGILSVRSLSTYQKIEPEVEKKETKKNILFLLMVLIGLNGSDLLEQEVKSAANKVEALRSKLDKKQQLVDKLNNRLNEISDLYDELLETGKKLEDLTGPEYQTYFIKSRQLQNMVEAAQLDVKLQMKKVNASMQEIVKSAKTEIEPLKQIVEALQNMGSKLSDLFNSQFGNNINFRR